MSAVLKLEQEEGICLLRLAGRLDAYAVPAIWPRARRLAEENAGRTLIVDCAAVEYCDGAGIALLVDLLRRGGGAVQVRDLAERHRQWLERFDPASFNADATHLPPRPSLLERLGRAGAALATDLRAQLVFLGEAGAALGAAVRRPDAVRWRDTWAIAEEAGVSALPIVGLIAFLMGVILAFQSAVAMRVFGAEIFVAHLVGISLLRELGPLMTAILLAGRSGAAFAAEIGSMKVSDELSAMQTMGLQPVQFLVVPRLLAGLLIAPLLTVYADLIGLAGAAAVMLLFDVPMITFVQNVIGFVQPQDFLGGMAKALVFGLLIAGIGCLRGMQAGSGASAVGLSATHAVVSGLVLIVAVDGLFALIYYHLGI